MHRTLLVAAACSLLASAGLAHPRDRAPSSLTIRALPDLHRAMFERKHTPITPDDPRAVAPPDARFATCFAEGTPQQIVEAFTFTPAPNPIAFQNAQRWFNTAYTPTTQPVGKPVIISWSIVPDGTPVAGFNGEPDAPSDLRAFLNGIYGSEAVWLPIFQSAFDRWGELSGVQYVYEANDDGVPLTSDVGVPGVRGDVRISGHFIDGNSGVLAYNFFPFAGDTGFGGDMVIDTADDFYNTTTNSNLRLRNVIQHEHGHGLGMAHVCPVEQTKLMEPFVSTAFDGLRHDDLRHVQFLYGDPLEPNDSTAQATIIPDPSCTPTTLGDSFPVPAGTPTNANPQYAQLNGSSILSISNSDDADVFSFTVSTTSRLNLAVQPVGYIYDDSAQDSVNCAGSGSCCSGNIINSNEVGDLQIELLDSAGNPVALADNSPLGGGESISGTLVPPGIYYLRVSAPTLGTRAQFYTATLAATDARLAVSSPNTSDLAIAAGTLVPLDLAVADDQQFFNPAASAVFFRPTNSGPFFRIPLVGIDGSLFRASIPDVLCSQSPQWYAELATTSGQIVRFPCTGTFNPVVGTRTVVFTDDFEINRGWTVNNVSSGGTLAGAWTRVAPIASASQTGVDTTVNGTFCFVTGQGTPGGLPGANDLDNGTTNLTSPTINLAGFSAASFITYNRWFNNGNLGNGYNDRFRTQVSTNNGSSWTTIETIGPGNLTDPNTNGGWRTSTLTLPAAPTATTRFRFVAEDVGNQNVIEAAVDDVTIVGRSCAATAWCVADLNLDGFVDNSDFVLFADAFNTFDCADPLMPFGCPADLNNDNAVDNSDFVLFADAYNNFICP